jgi:hypothetical protein
MPPRIARRDRLTGVRVHNLPSTIRLPTPVVDISIIHDAYVGDIVSQPVASLPTIEQLAKNRIYTNNGSSALVERAC